MLCLNSVIINLMKPFNHREERKQRRFKILKVVNRLTVAKATPPPIKANPAKAGDAKPWIYRHERDHDRQAAEDRN